MVNNAKHIEQMKWVPSIKANDFQKAKKGSSNHYVINQQLNIRYSIIYFSININRDVENKPVPAAVMACL